MCIPLISTASNWNWHGLLHRNLDQSPTFALLTSVRHHRIACFHMQSVNWLKWALILYFSNWSGTQKVKTGCQQVSQIHAKYSSVSTQSTAFCTQPSLAYVSWFPQCQCANCLLQFLAWFLSPSPDYYHLLFFQFGFYQSIDSLGLTILSFL